MLEHAILRYILKDKGSKISESTIQYLLHFKNLNSAFTVIKNGVDHPDVVRLEKFVTFLEKNFKKNFKENVFLNGNHK